MNLSTDDVCRFVEIDSRISGAEAKWFFFLFLFREGTRFGEADLKSTCLRKDSAAIKNL